MLAFFLSSRRRHTRCALVTGVQTCALPIYIDRNPQRVPVFGGGVHFCIGNRLARLVLRTGLEALVTQFPRLRLADPAFKPVYGGALSETQLVALPLRWD